MTAIPDLAAPAGTAPAPDARSAHNYHPLPVVIAEGQGTWVTDTDGRRYIDALAAYSALNFGHRHPRLLAVAREQLERVTLTSRAFHNDRFGPFCAAIADLCGKQAVLPMNTGAEAVETAIKTARRWGYQVREVPEDQATIIVADGNFHGRTTTIVGFSSDPDAREGFGPFTPGFRSVPYGDANAMAAAIDDTTVAILIEPIQGEAGVVIPPHGYLRALRDLCDEHGILLVADEIQSGLGRTGRTFACDHEDVVPDVYVLGKALGGGIVPVSAVVADHDILGVFTPGSHGSTFGGNPLACAVGEEVARMLATGEWQERAARLGEHLAAGLDTLPADAVEATRVRGLWAGIDLTGRSGRDVCEALLAEGVLAKDTHETSIRLAPPLTITEDEIDLVVEALGRVLTG